MSLTLAAAGLAMGVLGGGHCVAMCGGVASAACAGTGERRVGGRVFLSLAWSGGRVVTYAALGALCGVLGALPASVLPLGFVQVTLRVVAALVLVGFGLRLVGVMGPLSVAPGRGALGAPLWRRVSTFAKRFIPAKTAGQAFALGAAWGLVPCGLVYAALALAVSSGSAANGAATMAAFGVGTMPVFALLVGALRALGERWASRSARVAAGALLILLGAFQARLAVEQVDVASALRLDASPRATCCRPGDHAPEVIRASHDPRGTETRETHETRDARHAHDVHDRAARGRD